MADTQVGQVGRHVEKRFAGYGAQNWQGVVLERVNSSDQYLVRWHDGSETKMTTKAMDAADKVKVKTEQAAVANAARVSDKKASNKKAPKPAAVVSVAPRKRRHSGALATLTGKNRSSMATAVADGASSRKERVQSGPGNMDKAKHLETLFTDPDRHLQRILWGSGFNFSLM
jgi:hypothetical protein